MLTPETSFEVEYVPFSINFSIVPELPETIVDIESVSITASDGNDYSSDITVDITSSSTFTLSGVLADVFNRTMSYLDKDDQPGMVRKFKDIPADFSTLYKYTGANAETVDLTVSADCGVGGTYTATVIVRNNWEVSNAKLRDYVAKGKY